MSATATSAGPALELRNVSKNYGDSLAVDNVSIQLEAGTFLTMLGPSGSGKTTTLNIIAGFIEPDEGSVLLGGRDLTALAPHKRDIGMVFQNYALFPHLTALQNVAFPLEMRGVSRREARKKAMGALEMVELANRSGRLPKQLSGGQQQRVALARVIVFEPELLLMDEPLGALDKKLRETMQLEIMRISRNLDSTVVYVTHDQEEALVMSDLIAVYHDGKIAQLGSSADLYERPRTLFVADFIGESVLLNCVPADRSTLRGNNWVADMPNQNYASGNNGVLVIRPERMSVELADVDDTASKNVIEGTVTDAIYVGNAVKYVISTRWGQEITVRVDRARPSDRIQAGDPVRVRWNPDDATLVSTETTTASPAESE